MSCKYWHIFSFCIPSAYDNYNQFFVFVKNYLFLSLKSVDNIYFDHISVISPSFLFVAIIFFFQIFDTVFQLLVSQRPERTLPEAYLEPSRTSTMKLFSKNTIVDDRLDSKYTPWFYISNKEKVVKSWNQNHLFLGLQRLVQNHFKWSLFDGAFWGNS